MPSLTAEQVQSIADHSSNHCFELIKQECENYSVFAYPAVAELFKQEFHSLLERFVLQNEDPTASGARSTRSETVKKNQTKDSDYMKLENLLTGVINDVQQIKHTSNSSLSILMNWNDYTQTPMDQDTGDGFEDSYTPPEIVYYEPTYEKPAKRVKSASKTAKAKSEPLKRAQERLHSNYKVPAFLSRLVDADFNEQAEEILSDELELEGALPEHLKQAVAKPTNRGAFSLFFKAKAIRYAEHCGSVRKTALEFVGDEKFRNAVAVWVKNKEAIFTQLGKMLKDPKRKLRSRLEGGGRKPANPELEAQVVEWFKDFRNRNSEERVTHAMVKDKALEIGGEVWSTKKVVGFFRRHDLRRGE